MFTDVIIDLKNEETDNINQLQMALKEFPMQLHCGDVSEIMPKFSPSDRKILIITGHRLNLQTYGQTNWREQCAVLGYGVNYQGEASYIIEDWEALTQHFLDTVYARAFHQPLIIGETDRLQIREMTLQDLDDLYELYDSLKDCKYVLALKIGRVMDKLFRSKGISCFSVNLSIDEALKSIATYEQRMHRRREDAEA